MNSPAQPNDPKNNKPQDPMSDASDQGSNKQGSQGDMEEKIRHGDLPYQESEQQEKAQETSEKTQDSQDGDYGFLNEAGEKEVQEVKGTQKENATPQQESKKEVAVEKQQPIEKESPEPETTEPVENNAKKQEGSNLQQAGLPDLSGNNMGGSPPPGQMPPPPADNQESEGNGQDKSEKVVKKSGKKISPKVIAGVLGLLLLVGGGVVAVTQFTDFSGDIRQRAYSNPCSPTIDAMCYEQYGGTCQPDGEGGWYCTKPNLTPTPTEQPTPYPTSTPTPPTPAPNPCNPTRDAYCYDNFGGECQPDGKGSWYCTKPSTPTPAPNPCNPTRDAYCYDNFGGECQPANNDQGWKCTKPGPICGNGDCEQGETVNNCPQDCISCERDIGGVCMMVDACPQDCWNDGASDCSAPNKTCCTCTGTPTPSNSPFPTNTPSPKVGGACMTTKIYTEGSSEWVETSPSDLPDRVNVGDKIRLAVKGDRAGVVEGRFKINNSSWMTTTTTNEKGEYFIEYTLREGGQYTIAGEVLYGK